MRAHVISDDGVVLNTILVSSLGEGMISADIGGSIGQIWDGTTFSDPPIPLQEQKDRIAAERFSMETSGAAYNGMTILTDRESCQILDSTIEKIRRGLIPSVQWKCPEGYLELTPSNIDVIEIAILTHVQTAFLWEKAQLEALTAQPE